MSDKTIKGLTKVLKDLENFGNEAKKEVDTLQHNINVIIVAMPKRLAT